MTFDADPVAERDPAQSAALAAGLRSGGLRRGDTCARRAHAAHGATRPVRLGPSTGGGAHEAITVEPRKPRSARYKRTHPRGGRARSLAAALFAAFGALGRDGAASAGCSPRPRATGSASTSEPTRAARAAASTSSSSTGPREVWRPVRCSPESRRTRRSSPATRVDASLRGERGRELRGEVERDGRAFAVDPATGRLTLLNRQPTEGPIPAGWSSTPQAATSSSPTTRAGERCSVPALS